METDGDEQNEIDKDFITIIKSEPCLFSREVTIELISRLTRFFARQV